MSDAENAFKTRNGSRILERILNSPNKFCEKEWIKFFVCLKNISIFFVRSSGSLQYIILVLSCFQMMTGKLTCASLKFDILIDLMFALYKFACEIKYLYGFDNSVVQNFCKVQETLKTIINEQNYEDKELEIFVDLNNLTYAAFHNGIGRPELTKQQLKKFFVSYDENPLPIVIPSRIRSIIIALYFYHMAIAYEEVAMSLVDKKKSIDYVTVAYEMVVQNACFERKFEFPFYSQILLGKLYCFLSWFKFVYSVQIPTNIFIS